MAQTPAPENTHILDHGLVIDILSGDALILSDGRIIRLAGLRTYEPFFLGWVDKINPSRLLYAQKALKRTRELVFKRDVKLEFPLDIEAPPNQFPAYVYLEDGRCLNEILLQEGLAQILIGTPDHPLSSRFEKLQKDAYDNNRGLWSVDYQNLKISLAPEKPQFDEIGIEDYTLLSEEKDKERASGRMRGIITLFIIILLIAGVFSVIYILIRKGTKICPMCHYPDVPKDSDVCPNCNYNFKTGYLGDVELQTWVTKNIRIAKRSSRKSRKRH